MNSSDSSVSYHSANSVTFTPLDHKVDVQKHRHIFKYGTYPDGQHYYLALMVKGDGKALYGVSETIRNDDSESLIYRSTDDFERMIDRGMVVGLYHEDGALFGMSAIECLDDEDIQHGTGPEVWYQNKRNNTKQVNWKALAVLPEARGKEKGYKDELYKIREILTVMTGRPIAVMKINVNFTGLIDRNVADGWHNVSKEPHKDVRLVYAENTAHNGGKIVDVLVADTQLFATRFQENKQDFILPDVAIIGYGPTNISLQ